MNPKFKAGDRAIFTGRMFGLQKVQPEVEIQVVLGRDYSVQIGYKHPLYRVHCRGFGVFHVSENELAPVPPPDAERYQWARGTND